jgi:hypothetical protein
MLGEGEEIAEQFLRFPSMLNASQMRDYEDFYHQDFQAILPSVSCLVYALGLVTSERRYFLTFLTAAKTRRGNVFYLPRRVAVFTEGHFEYSDQKRAFCLS